MQKPCIQFVQQVSLVASIGSMISICDCQNCVRDKEAMTLFVPLLHQHFRLVADPDVSWLQPLLKAAYDQHSSGHAQAAERIGCKGLC